MIRVDLPTPSSSNIISLYNADLAGSVFRFIIVRIVGYELMHDCRKANKAANIYACPVQSRIEFEEYISI
jgi:hypothetical protein